MTPTPTTEEPGPFQMLPMNAEGHPKSTNFINALFCIYASPHGLWTRVLANNELRTLRMTPTNMPSRIRRITGATNGRLLYSDAITGPDYNATTTRYRRYDQSTLLRVLRTRTPYWKATDVCDGFYTDRREVQLDEARSHQLSGNVFDAQGTTLDLKSTVIRAGIAVQPDNEARSDQISVNAVNNHFDTIIYVSPHTCRHDAATNGLLVLLMSLSAAPPGYCGRYRKRPRPATMRNAQRIWKRLRPPSTAAITIGSTDYASSTSLNSTPHGPTPSPSSANATALSVLTIYAGVATATGPDPELQFHEDRADPHKVRKRLFEKFRARFPTTSAYVPSESFPTNMNARNATPFEMAASSVRTHHLCGYHP